MSVLWVGGCAAGTLSDKVAAMTLLVQEAPLFRLKTLDMLLGLASKGDRRCTQMAVEAIKVHNTRQAGRREPGR